MKITRLETFVIGDGPKIDPDKGAVEPMACIRVHTDDGLIGLTEVFRVPPGVVQAVVGDADSHFGRLLIGQEVTHPERLWQRMWDALIHTNRRGWQVIILGALDVAVWDLYGQSLGKPVYELMGGVQRGLFQTHSETPVSEAVPYCTLVSDVWGEEAMIRQQCERAEKLALLGYRAFKAEPMMSSPALVVEMARRVRETIGPDRTLMIDVGYGFNDVPTAARILPTVGRIRGVLFWDALSGGYAGIIRAVSRRQPGSSGDGGTRRHPLWVPWPDGTRRRAGGAALCFHLRRLDRSQTDRGNGPDARGLSLPPATGAHRFWGRRVFIWPPIRRSRPLLNSRLPKCSTRRCAKRCKRQATRFATGPLRSPTRPGIGYELPESILRDFAQ